MEYTGTKATEEEVAELKELAEKAASTPVMAMSVADGLAGNDFSARAHKRMQRRCHELARGHGLPEIEGFYGIDLATREFVKAWPLRE